MLTTNIPKLDKLIGGLPESSNILLAGPPGSGKLAFALQFLAAGLKEKQPGIFITTDSLPSEIEKRGLEFDFDFFPYTQKDLLKFVDSFSWTLTKAQAIPRPNDIKVPGTSALNELSLGISSAVAEVFKPGLKLRVAFSSLSTLLLYNNPSIIYKFLQITGARLKSTCAVSLYIIESGMHDEKIITTLNHLTDGTIEFKKQGETSMLRIPRLAGGKTFSSWMKFKIGKQKI